MQFREVSTLKSNITSSLDLRGSLDKFGLITRQLAKDSSKFVHRLQIYNFQKMQKQSSTDIYETYSEETHFIKFISDRNLVAVSTKFEIRFYQIEPLQLKKVYLHQQSNVYDLQVSSDGELVVMVGIQIKVWRTNGFRPLLFPQVILSARYCAFSKDNKFMVITSNNQINIYSFSRETGQYMFTPLNSVQTPPNNEDITSIQFNPNDSNEMIVGFLNVSPQFFKLDTQYFAPVKDIQPLATKNAKKANYMPDGKRFLSSDSLNGIGLWPGVGNKLFYKQSYLLYNLRPINNGTRFIGRIWQQIKIIQIQVQCTPQNFKPQCQCSAEYIWDYAGYSCQPLTCLQKQFATGDKKNNQCVCIEGYTFNRALMKCMITCKSIQHAVWVNPNTGFCYCKDNFQWDQANKKCIFSCKSIPFSIGQMIQSQKCQCKTGFLWNQQFKQCVCPKYAKVFGQTCICYDQYIEDENGKCILDCLTIAKSAGNMLSQQQCQCQTGHFFTQYAGLVGCKLNCSDFANTQTLSPGFQTCICIQNMNWKNDMCKINCGAVGYASGQSTQKQNQCNCAVNYLWIDEIHQCGKNCTGVSFVDQTKRSTLRSCPCIKNFDWNQQQKFCQIDCIKINNTNPYSLINPSECQCRGAFKWDKDRFECHIDCKKVWDAKERIDDYSCSCNSDKIFNSTKNTCDAAGAQSLFNNIWTIIGFVACIIVFVVIMVILVRYCWQFKTKNNRQHQKKLKTNDLQTKPRKRKISTGKELIQNNNLLSDDRLGTKTAM